MTAPPTPLSTFLLERVADRERIAEDAGGGGWDVVHDAVPHVEDSRTGEVICQTQRDEWARHIGWHNPQQVLLECAAQRRIVDVYVRTAHAMDRVTREEETVYVGARVAAEEAALVAKLLALPYADHPDYREEWRP